MIQSHGHHTFPIQLQHSWLSNPGTVRSHNEDAVLAEYPIFVVADGMGGHDAGDVASSQVAKLFRSLAGRKRLTAELVIRAITEASRRVTELSAQSGRGAGTTLSGVAVVVDEGRYSWLVFNIGDSRVYRLMAGTLEQITVDHSVVQELLDTGQLTQEAAAEAGYRNVITRALGDAVGAVDYWLMPITNGERLLICSDGLSGELSPDVLRSQLLYGGSTGSTTDSLMRLALEQQARDNVSLIVLDVLAGGQSIASDTETRADSVNGHSFFDHTNGYVTDAETTQTVEVPRRSR